MDYAFKSVSTPFLCCFVALFWLNPALTYGQDAPASTAAPVELKIAETDLVRKGVFEFPQQEATVFCDTAGLRLSVWNNNEYLYVQAILWKDNDWALGKTSDGRQLGDHSVLMLDIDADGKRTKDVDRDYMLNPWPNMGGMHYDICLEENSTTQIMSDTHGRGAIRYVSLGKGWRVRVDSFVIPLAEISRKVSDKIRLAYYGYSPQPEITVNSTDFDRGGRAYYSYHVPLASYHDYVLAKGAALALDGVPDGRRDPSLVAPRHREQVPEVGTVAPEVAAQEWLNTDVTETLGALRGHVVLVEFWATWCGPCVASIPHLIELQKEYGEGKLKILSFTEQSRQVVEAFAKRRAMTYVIGTESETTFDRYGVTGIPQAFVVGKSGKISWTGNSGDPALNEAIRTAVAGE